ncbi:hypothetical protein VTP01DRAFT_8778 [Rhizomucor pusillus]|uniref:uncharacterized protein n=1 Tax=Rhizomucor pusillus TaxID=4840 RepID=UPI0037434C16
MFKQARRPSSFRNSYCEGSLSPCCQNAVARLQQENQQLKQALKECRANMQRCEKEYQQAQRKLKESLFLAEKEAMQRAYTQQCDEHAQDLLRLKANTQDALTFDEDPCLKANETYKQALSYSTKTTDSLLQSIKASPHPMLSPYFPSIFILMCKNLQDLVGVINHELASLENHQEQLSNNIDVDVSKRRASPPPPTPPHRTGSRSSPLSMIIPPQPQRQPSARTAMRRSSIQAVSPVLSISSGSRCSSSSSSSEASLEELPDSPRQSLEHWKISKRDI